MLPQLWHPRLKGTMLKNILLILVAVFIDLLQIGITVAFAFIGAFSGTLGGAVAGNRVATAVCGLIGGGFLQGCQAIGTTAGAAVGTVANGFIAEWATPIATFIGLLINSAVSISIGTGFILLLFANEIASFKDLTTITPFYIAKVIPISDVAPCWTILVIRLSLKNKLANVLDVKKIAVDAVKGAVEGIETGPEGMVAEAAVAVTKGATKRLVNDGINGKINLSKPSNTSGPASTLHDFNSTKHKAGSPPSYESSEEFTA